MNGFLNIAHRGASAYAPENTIAAYDLALLLGANALELDVHETRDGVLVALHDEEIGRCVRAPSGRGLCVDDLTWDELARLNAGSWFNETHPGLARPEYSSARVPRLQDVFERYGRRVSYFIELKQTRRVRAMEQGIVDLVKRYGLTGPGPAKVLVGSFSQRCLKDISELDPDIELVQLFHPYATSTAIRGYLSALPAYCSGIGPSKEVIEYHLMQAAKLLGLDVYAWTVNGRHEMSDLMELGVAGIVTDFPDILDALIPQAPAEAHEFAV